MKKTLFLRALVLLLLLAACGSREAREPEPAWPDRLTAGRRFSCSCAVSGREHRRDTRADIQAE